MSNDFDWFALAAGLALLAAAEEDSCGGTCAGRHGIGAETLATLRPAHTGAEIQAAQSAGISSRSIAWLSTENGIHFKHRREGAGEIATPQRPAQSAGTVSGTADGIKPPALSMDAELPENPGAHSPVDECAPGEDFMEQERRTR